MGERLSTWPRRALLATSAAGLSLIAVTVAAPASAFAASPAAHDQKVATLLSANYLLGDTGGQAGKGKGHRTPKKLPKPSHHHDPH